MLGVCAPPPSRPDPNDGAGPSWLRNERERSSIATSNAPSVLMILTPWTEPVELSLPPPVLDGRADLLNADRPLHALDHHRRVAVVRALDARPRGRRVRELEEVRASEAVVVADLHVLPLDRDHVVLRDRDQRDEPDRTEGGVDRVDRKSTRLNSSHS